MNHFFSFEKLNVWNDCRQLIKMVYTCAGKFPHTELWGLQSQICRSAISISSNLAEGSGRSSGKDQARFSTIAYSSLLELVNQLIIAKELHYIQEADYLKLREQSEKVAAKISALKKYQKSLTDKR